jgi:short-subunit dehydrogenase
MMSFFETIATWWISRRASRGSKAVAAAAGRTPAVIITGGGSGIGLAIARQFAPRASAIVLIGRHEKRLQVAARGLAKAHNGLRILTFALDVGRPNAGEILLQWLENEELLCDVLVNSAACDSNELEALIATNVAGLSRLTRAVLPGMLARGSGGVLSIASLGGVIPGPWQAAYYASKAYVISLSEAISAETAGRGVRVAVVLPGPVLTRFHARMGSEAALYRRLIVASTPDRIARIAVRSFRLGRRVIAPGPIPTILAYALRILPHTLTVPIIGWLLAVRRARGRPRQGPP